MGLLDKKVAIITGAGTGIGRETAVLLAEEGATVVLVGRRGDVLREVAEAIQERGGRAFERATDIGSRDDVTELIKWVRGSFGQIDLLVNNAGSASKVLN